MNPRLRQSLQSQVTNLSMEPRAPKSIKVGLSPSQKVSDFCIIESSLKMMKNDFFTSKKFFGHVEKTAGLER